MCTQDADVGAGVFSESCSPSDREPGDMSDGRHSCTLRGDERASKRRCDGEG